MTILNFKLETIYQKPSLTELEKDIYPLNYETIKNIIINSHINPIYNDIFNNNFEGIKNYASKNKIFFNMSKQTPLMFAAKINNIDAVKLLINEHGRIDNSGRCAINFTDKVEKKKILDPYEE